MSVSTEALPVNQLSAIVRLLRLHQWSKNALLAIPLLASHGAGGANALPHLVLGMAAFCLCASAVYVLNDLLDIESDRSHPSKRARPLASGEVSPRAAIALIPALLLPAMLVATWLPRRFGLLLAGYCAVTCLYSCALKGRPVLDALCLAGLYTLRITTGAAAAQVPLSVWLPLFSVFLFLSLAFVKRYAELDALRRAGRLRAAARGYCVEDLPVLQSLGIGAGYVSVLVLALYINSPAIAELYHRPKVIWTLCVLLLYWISRVWMQAHRGVMNDDPVVFALKDPISLGIGVLAAFTVAVAI